MFDHHELPDDVEHEGTHEMSGGSDVFPRRSFSSFTASRLPSTFWGQLLPPRLRAPSAAGIASSAKFIINMGIDCLRQACGGELRAADAPWLLPLRTWLLGGVLRPSTGENQNVRRRRAPEQRAFDARRRQGQGCSWVTIFKLAATIFKLHGPCHHLMDPVSI